MGRKVMKAAPAGAAFCFGLFGRWDRLYNVDNAMINRTLSTESEGYE